MEKREVSPESDDLRSLRSPERMSVDSICRDLRGDEDLLVQWMGAMSDQVASPSTIKVFIHVVAQSLDYRREKFVSFYSRRYEELRSLIPEQRLKDFTDLIDFICEQQTLNLLRRELNDYFRKGYTGVISSKERPDKQAS